MKPTNCADRKNLVNKNFYNLFTQYEHSKSIFIPENRLFMTNGPKINGYVVQGIRTIPDALLILYDKKLKTPLQISLVEYECFGEEKIRAGEKSQYLNFQIISRICFAYIMKEKQYIIILI